MCSASPGIRSSKHPISTGWWDEIFLESLFLLHSGPHMEAVRTKEWKDVRCFPNTGEQYDEDDVDFAGNT